ncbi:MAG: hydantoinase B/oxoprolinase family protein [Planctomycetota bacterium]
MSDSASPVLLRVYQNLLDSVAEEMGSALERTGFSANIKERRDYSCAVFDAAGDMVAQAAHIPVHLGSTPLSVRAAIDAHRFRPGDVILLNDPYQGGTHLPDLTMVAGVFEADHAAPTFYVANRAHHADVGGAVRGSMALFTEIYQEGLRIPPVLLRDRGRVAKDVETLLLANMRQPVERRGDLRAQLSANEVGDRALQRLLACQPRAELLAYCGHLQDAADRHVRALLRRIPSGRYEAEDELESDGVTPERIALRVTIEVDHDRACFDFSRSSPQVRGGLNTNPAVVLSAVFYVLRGLAGEEIPANAGCLRSVEVRTAPGTVLDPRLPAAVAGGNVETSQRLVDLLFRGLAPALPDLVPAQSQGTMNNLTLGSTGAGGRTFSYYETMGGGAGGSARGPGASAVHSHMTNTRNTPIEVLEHALPIRVREYSIRRGTGGAGRHGGGEGIAREFELLEPVMAALLTERRYIEPAGMAGGSPGACGRNRLLLPGASEWTELPSKWVGELPAGSRLRIETPGGGGWGHDRDR